MDVKTKNISDADASELLSLNESHFLDLKSARISPSKISKTISAFANSSGGELFVGIEELEGIEGPERRWDGFANEESANAVFQVLESLDSLGSSYEAEFLAAPISKSLVLHITVFKTQQIVPSTDGTVFRRRSAQNLPVAGDALERLRLDKGIGTVITHAQDRGTG